MATETIETMATLTVGETGRVGDREEVVYRVTCERVGGVIQRVNGHDVDSKLMETEPVTRHHGWLGEAVGVKNTEYNRLSQVLGGLQYNRDSERSNYSLVLYKPLTDPSMYYPRIEFWKMARFHVGNCGRCYAVGYVGQSCDSCPGPVRPICTRMFTKGSPNTFVLPCDLAMITNASLFGVAKMLGDLKCVTQEEVDAMEMGVGPTELDTNRVVNDITKGTWKKLMPNVGKKQFLQ
jgi:hypothetical protein